MGAVPHCELNVQLMNIMLLPWLQDEAHNNPTGLVGTWRKRL